MKIYPFTLLTASLCVAQTTYTGLSQDIPAGFAMDDEPLPVAPASTSTAPGASENDSDTSTFTSSPTSSAPSSSSSTPSSTSPSVPTPTDDDVAGEVEALTAFGANDPNFVLPNQPVESVMGFSKTPLETPRSISVISSEMIDLLSLNDVQDLTKVAPNTFTTTRWGVQGNIDIRNMTADTYFRGIKRIEPQGNSRTTLGANDQIEIIRGAPAPYLGPGKIGGYSNLSPKSGRSRQGKYLTDPTGFFQAIYGSFDRQEISFGYGGPMNVLEDLNGGFYVYGMLDDSDTFYNHIPANQKILQAAVSQDLPNGWRLETGANLQRTETAGGFLNRLTQELVDNGVYWSGRPLVNLDTDNSGKIDVREMELNSPTLNRQLSGGNRPLRQRWDSRYQSVLDGTSPNVDINNPPVNSALEALMGTSLAPYIDQQTANLLALMPRGFVMDPDSMEEVAVDYAAVALERELLADLGLVYLDFIKDDFDDLRIKNQLFFDSQDQFKQSELPYYQKQDVYVWENKFTLQKDFNETPEWLDKLSVIVSPNVRGTWARIKSYGGDYDDRPDIMRNNNERTPFDLFITPFENSDPLNGGAFWDRHRRSTYTEFGFGTMVDTTFWEKVNFTTGARVDYITGETVDKAGVWNITGGNIDDPSSRIFNQDRVATGDDFGISHSHSLSYNLPGNIRPYITYAEQSTLMDGSNITIARGAMAAGAYEKATLEEIGVKGSFLDDTLFATLTGYRQYRSSFTDEVGNAVVTNTEGEGLEMELRWAPRKDFYASLFGVVQQTYILSPNANWIHYHGEDLGFRDITDANGQVIYPAEAFTWAGRPDYRIQDGEKTEHPGYPNTQVGFNTAYTFPFGLTVGGSAAYAAEVHSGRNQKIILPEYITIDLNFSYEYKGWRVKFDIFNVNDELYFRGRNGVTRGDALISAMQPRRYQLAVSKSF